MMRLIALSCVFAGITGALVIALAPPVETDRGSEVVTRAQGAPLTLQPAIPRTAPAILLQPAATRPQARPVALIQPEPDAAPGPAPQQPALAATGAEERGKDDVMKQLESMSYGIMQQLKKPVDPARAKPRVAMAPSKPNPAPAPAALATVDYVVQPGDSLPGLAFRFFGTTAAYLTIVDANPVLADDLGAFRAGMTLVIPKTP